MRSLWINMYLISLEFIQQQQKIVVIINVIFFCTLQMQHFKWKQQNSKTSTSIRLARDKKKIIEEKWRNTKSTVTEQVI